jgi:O-acetyl-ADP-ribose deacetylase (regulator of RNase III)
VSQTFKVGRTLVTFDQGDITAQDTDVIVNAANSSLLGGGGVDGAIHRAAGPALLEACRAIAAALPNRRLATGGAVLTAGFGLRARHVIHCVGPVYHAAGADAADLLASCYREALALCRAHGLRSVAFPSISTGAYGYPVHAAAAVALRAVRGALEGAPEDAPALVTFVLFDEHTLAAYLGAARAVLV